ncbi:hypothetical protein C7M61_004726 [Candidozyma pseudohaemuli]|uniref:SWR1-complex protein 5 n=1 Tax=Candidozyma pseudohaemuli TaxID=418784 RepID=A0A2P7YH26_9ASCO|nr:hypothetical protein C7M61_004726 [[Candida] pseudohaemulonii]PSK35268.1 hypothetical protein C7M61_004726 [[Candida] pseudohaemulonii]
MARKEAPAAPAEPATQPDKKNTAEGNLENEEEDYVEEDDEDYDPEKKQQEEDQESDNSDNEPEPDYSAINTGVSQVRTRTQRYEEELGGGKKRRIDPSGLLQDELRVDVNAIFESLKSGNDDTDWTTLIDKDAVVEEKKPEEPTDPHETRMVRIETSYTFAGKLVKELKMVQADSAEAKAYLNSASGITIGGEGEGQKKLFVTVVRTIKGTDEQVPLMIKLKRPSLIDKFLKGDKKNKLTTLEKSRLDWASYVDEEKIQDDLALHNKAGYLDKQDFLGRMDAKRDVQYQRAKELERQRQWQLQQKGK